MNRADAIRLARQLRKNSTKAEKEFWFYVRNRRFHGHKFTRQFPIEFKLYDNRLNFFIADFYCHQFRLVVEIDGDYHHRPEIKRYDEDREKIINAMGYHVMRFDNDQVLNHFDQVEQDLLSLMNL